MEIQAAQATVGPNCCEGGGGGGAYGPTPKAAALPPDFQESVHSVNAESHR